MDPHAKVSAILHSNMRKTVWLKKNPRYSILHSIDLFSDIKKSNYAFPTSKRLTTILLSNITQYQKFKTVKRKI